MSEEELLHRLEAAQERIQFLEGELEGSERRLKRFQSIVVWTGWIAALAILGFSLVKTLFSSPVEIVEPPVIPVSAPQKPSSIEPKPVLNPPPSVSPPPEMPGFPNKP